MSLERIGKYPVERKLGSGGMGALYLARHPDLGRLVAIKTLKADCQGDLELRERFLREARSAAQLAHPNIVKVHDFVADADQPFIVMEYVDGDTLARRLREEPPLTLDEKLSLLEQLCSGLAHAHAAGVVHRDIKPANLMVDRQQVLRILDFGIARLGNSGMTLEGQMMGSVNYMSPEQVVGRGVDARTDLFAAGAVMYEVLSREQAFPGGIDGGVLHRILNESPPPLSQRVPNIDPALVAIVERAMQRDSGARYQQAVEMQRDLARVRQRLQRGEPTATRIRPSDDTARVDALRIAELKRRQLAEYVQAGTEAYSRRQFDSALQFAERAIAVDASHQPALDLYDRAQFDLQSQQVRERLDAAVASLSEDRLDEAEAAVAQASSALPRVPEASVLADQVRAVAAQVAAARERERRIALSLERARSSIAQGGYDTALRSVYEVLALDPDRAEARALERQAQTQLQARREAERAERAARSELVHARDLIDQGLLDAAAAVVAAVEPTSDTIRAELAEAASYLERARHAEHVATVVAAARQLLEKQRFDDVLAALAELPPEDAGGEAQVVRVAAEAGIERRRSLERQRQAVEEGLRAVEGLVEAGNLERALERLEEVARVGLKDSRIDEMRGRVTEQLAQQRARQSQEARDRQAERRVSSARQLLDQGQEQEAVDLLLRDDDHSIVRQALEEIRAEVARRERVREEEARRRAEETAERQRLEAEQQRRAEAERQQQEAERQRLAEAERLRREAEAARVREEAAERQRQQAERQQQEAERQRLAKAEAERVRREAEAARLQVEAAERQRQQAERQQQEAERQRLAKAEAERVRREAEATRLQAEAAERQRQEAEQQRLAKAEAERVRREAEATRFREEAAEDLRSEDATLVLPDARAATLIRPPEVLPAQTADTWSLQGAVGDRRVQIAAGLIVIGALGVAGWVLRPASQAPDAEVAAGVEPSTPTPAVEPRTEPTPVGGTTPAPPPKPAPNPVSGGTSKPPVFAPSPPPTANPTGRETLASPDPPGPAQTGQVPVPVQQVPPPVAQGPAPVPPPVVTTPEPSPAAPPPVPRVNVEAERTAIARVFDRYVEAYQTMDEARIRAVDPTFGRFDPRTRTLLRTVRMTLSPLVITLADDGLSATVSTTQSVVNTWERAGLPTNPPPVAKRWNLRKAGSDWRIVP